MPHHLKSCVVSLALFACASFEATAQQITNDARVYPLTDKGQLTGCQVGFSVLRVDDEYSDGRPALANGLILFNKQNATVGLRLGVATDAALVRFNPPDRAYFFSKFKSNAADVASKFDSSDEGFRFFVFTLGEDTTSILLELLESGKIDIMYAPVGASVEARFTFDLASKQKPWDEFNECMAALFKKTP